jgi:hypothetical protein
MYTCCAPLTRIITWWRVQERHALKVLELQEQLQATTESEQQATTLN